MADDDKNLVSEIKVEGVDASTEQLKKFGEEGASAFDRMAAAAAKAGDVIGKASDSMSRGLKEVNDNLGLPNSKIEALVATTKNLGSAFSAGVKGVVQFAEGLASVGAATAATIVGVAKFASSITATVRNVDAAVTANKEWTAQQKKNNQQLAQSVASSAQYDSQVRQLNAAVAQGKVSYEDYATQLNDLNSSFRESQRVQAEVQAAQDETLRKNQQLDRQLADRNALEQLNKKYGTELTQSLIKLGGAYDIVANKVRDAFGPVAAKILDSITTMFENNGKAISAFIDRLAASFTNFIKENGPAIAQLGSQLIEIGAAMARIITTVVLPAFTTLLGWLGNIAATFNRVFGTDLSAALIVAIGLIGTMSGAFATFASAIPAVVAAIAGIITVLTPMGALIALLTAAFAAFVASVDWAAFGQRAVAAGQLIVNFFTTLPAKITEIFTAIFAFIQEGFTLLIEFILQQWQTVIDFFTNLVTQVQTIFTNIKQVIIDAFNSALEYVKGLFASWSKAAMSYIQPIIDALNKVKSLMGSVSGGGGDASVSAAGGGLIRGPGTSTSDSIPAWLSDNEFVVRARAVRKYGVAFLRAINSGKLDLGRIAKFAAGGLVTMPNAPRFASGGSVTSTSSGSARVINLAIGGELFEGLLAPEDVANKMTRFAISRGTRSAGRKPAWVGGR